MSSDKAVPPQQKPNFPNRKTLTRAIWIGTARTVLERHGIASVKVDRLARRLKVTRGSFYFHFRGIEDLLASLLEEWRERNCRPFQALHDELHVDGVTFFEMVSGEWIREDSFRPLLDLAIRDWSRTSRRLAEEVAAADDLRIMLLTRAFLSMGYASDEAVVRARITYFHQIGYYALQFKETVAERLRFRPLYVDVLLGPLGERAASVKSRKSRLHQADSVAEVGEAPVAARQRGRMSTAR